MDLLVEVAESASSAMSSVSFLSLAIAAAVRLVSSSCPDYRDRWISAQEWASILCKEYDIPKELVARVVADALSSCSKEQDYCRQMAFQGGGGGSDGGDDPSAKKTCVFRRPAVNADSSKETVPEAAAKTKASAEAEGSGVDEDDPSHVLFYISAADVDASQKQQPKGAKDCEPFVESTSRHCLEVVTPQTRFQLLSAVTQEIENRKAASLVAAQAAGGISKKRPADTAFGSEKVVAAAAQPDDDSHKKRPTINYSQRPLVPILSEGTGMSGPSLMPLPLGMHPVAFPQYRAHLEASKSTAKVQKELTKEELLVRKRADKVETLLKQFEDCKPNAAVAVLHELLKRKSMQDIRQGLQQKLEADSPLSVEGIICNGIQEFLQHHHGSARLKVEQHAIDAVQTAVCFSNQSTQHVGRIGQRLGLPSGRSLKKYIPRINEMKQSGAKFAPKERRKRKDCYRDEAAKYIHEFIHSDQVSSLDPRSKRVFKVKNAATNQVESHPARVWNLKCPVSARYRDFLQSDSHAAFEEKAGRTVGDNSFRRALCECIREPKPDDC